MSERENANPYAQELAQARLLSTMTGEPLNESRLRTIPGLLLEQTRLIGILATQGGGNGLTEAQVRAIVESYDLDGVSESRVLELLEQYGGNLNEAAVRAIVEGYGYLSEPDVRALILEALAVDETPPVEEEPPPEIPPDDPEPEPVEPIVYAGDEVYIPDAFPYSPLNKPRLSSSGAPDYLPNALTSTPGNLRFFGIRFAPSQNLSFRGLQVPLRARQVQQGDRFWCYVLRKVGDVWMTVNIRTFQLSKNAPQAVWNRTLTFNAGEEWAVIVGISGGAAGSKLDRFYATDTPYPAAYGASSIGTNQEMPSTIGRLYELTPSSGQRSIRMYGVNLEADVIYPLEDGQGPGNGNGGAGNERETITHTTGNIPQNGFAHFTTDLPFTAVVRRVTLSHAGRVRVYATEAARIADADRAIGSPPADTVAPFLLIEAVLPLAGALSIPFVNAVITTANGGTGYGRIDNRHDVAAAYTVEAELLTLEPRDGE